MWSPLSQSIGWCLIVRDETTVLPRLVESLAGLIDAWTICDTLRDLGTIDEAIGWYRKRAELGGWDEEVFYSLLQTDLPEAYRHATESNQRYCRTAIAQLRGAGEGVVPSSAWSAAAGPRSAPTG